MTELETAIIVLGPVVGTVAGTILGYSLRERGESKRFRREIAVRPLEYQQGALREACYALMDFMITYGKQKDDRKSMATILTGDQLSIPMNHAFLWCSEETASKLTDFTNKSTALADAAMSGTSFPQKEEDEFIDAFSSAYSSMAEELGVNILVSQLKDIARSFGHRKKS